jgi:hypothetical protein
MPLILGTNSIKDTGYDVANSCRFDDGSSDRLTKTYSSSGDRNKFTFSMWLKRGQISNTTRIFGVYQNAQYSTTSYISGGGNFVFIDTYNSGEQAKAVTDMVFRDVSAWYNIIVVYDRNNSTSADKLIIYVNGERVSLSTYTAPSQATTLNSDGLLHEIGAFNNSDFYDGYISEFVFCDGQALDQTSFGEFDSDTNIWKPIDVSGLTFGNNGFYLDFENSGSLGADVSGNGNNFTVNNLTSIDQTTDTCTNNFATGNPLNYNPPTFSDGNLTANSSSGWDNNLSTIAVDNGKWYAEFKQVSTDGTLYTFVGISEVDGVANAGTTSLFDLTTTKAYHQDGQVYTGTGSGNTGVSYGDTFAVGDIIGIALDMDNLKMYFSKNGVWQNSGDPTSGATGTGAVSINAGNYYICTLAFSSGTNVISSNFGNPPFTISSGNSDGNGYGNFEYSVPSEYYALNSKNLAEYG